MNPRRVETACGAMMVPSIVEDRRRLASRRWLEWYMLSAKKPGHDVRVVL